MRATAPDARACLRACAIFLALCGSTAASDTSDDSDAARDPAFQRLFGLAVSGKALERVADRIDPEQPLGSCATTDSGPRVRVTLTNVRNAKGRIRISLFGREPSQWVRTKGGKLLRFDVPASRGHMHICMPLPDGGGVYAVALYHDENADGKYSLAAEGYGFSNNARAGLFGPPSHRDAAFVAAGPTTEVDIHIRY